MFGQQFYWLYFCCTKGEAIRRPIGLTREETPKCQMFKCICVMKSILNFTVLMATVMGTWVACNEDNVLYEDRAERTFEVVVLAETSLTDAEEAMVAEVLADNKVDTSSMLVTTDNVAALASTIELQLEPVETAMMIGFKLEDRESTDERYAARVVLGGYVIE